jgi:hypothetical protein
MSWVFWTFLRKGDEKRGDIKKPLKGVSGAYGFGLNIPICG